MSGICYFTDLTCFGRLSVLRIPSSNSKARISGSTRWSCYKTPPKKKLQRGDGQTDELFLRGQLVTHAIGSPWEGGRIVRVNQHKCWQHHRAHTARDLSLLSLKCKTFKATQTLIIFFSMQPKLVCVICILLFQQHINLNGSRGEEKRLRSSTHGGRELRSQNLIFYILPEGSVQFTYIQNTCANFGKGISFLRNEKWR